MSRIDQFRERLENMIQSREAELTVSYSVNAFAPVLVLTFYALFGCFGYMLWGVMLPIICKENMLKGIIFTVIGTFILLSIVKSHWYAMRTKPGYVSSYYVSNLLINYRWKRRLLLEDPSFLTFQTLHTWERS